MDLANLFWLRFNSVRLFLMNLLKVMIDTNSLYIVIVNYNLNLGILQIMILTITQGKRMKKIIKNMVSYKKKRMLYYE